MGNLFPQEATGSHSYFPVNLLDGKPAGKGSPSYGKLPVGKIPVENFPMGSLPTGRLPMRMVSI
jgi:hypothetical protein